MKTSITILLSLFTTLHILSQDKSRGLYSISKESIQAPIEFLASDWLEGRETGTKGGYIAAEYIQSLLKMYGIKPCGDYITTSPDRQDRENGIKPIRTRSYFQKFNLTRYADATTSTLEITNKNGIIYSFEHNVDYKCSRSVASLDVTSNFVFVKYGIKDESLGVNDYKSINAKGKIIVRLSGTPKGSSFDKKYSNPKQIKRLKNNAAIDAGAIAVLEYNPLSGSTGWAVSPDNRENIRDYEGDKKRASFYDKSMCFPEKNPHKEFLEIKINKKIFESLFPNNHNSLKEIKSKETSDISIRIKYHAQKENILCRNVLGIIPGKDTSNIVVIGAHYDHLGKHDGYIWNGANDNASGVSGIINIAKAFNKSGIKPENTIIIAFWDAEERGLFGSQYFVRETLKRDKKIKYNLTFDMIGRSPIHHPNDNMCNMAYTKQYDQIEKLANKNLEQYNLNLKVNFRPSGQLGAGGSDQASFARKGIPLFCVLGDFYNGYHQVNDSADKVNYEKAQAVTQLSYLILWDLVNQKHSTVYPDN